MKMTISLVALLLVPYTYGKAACNASLVQLKSSVEGAVSCDDGDNTSPREQIANKVESLIGWISSYGGHEVGGQWQEYGHQLRWVLPRVIQTETDHRKEGAPVFEQDLYDAGTLKILAERARILNPAIVGAIREGRPDEALKRLDSLAADLPVCKKGTPMPLSDTMPYKNDLVQKNLDPEAFGADPNNFRQMAGFDLPDLPSEKLSQMHLYVYAEGSYWAADDVRADVAEARQWIEFARGTDKSN